MNTKHQESLLYFQKLSDSNIRFTPETLADHLIARFESRASKNSRIKKTTILANDARSAKIYLTTGWSLFQKSKLKQLIMKYRRDYAQKHGTIVKQAKTFKWDIFKNVAKNLWLTKVRKYSDRNRRRKMASLIPYIAFFAGARWGDIMNIRWENIIWYKESRETGRKTAVIVASATKNNAVGDHYTSYPLSEQKLTKHNSIWDCPYRALLRHYVYMGFPSSGNIFVLSDGKPMTPKQSYDVFSSAFILQYPPSKYPEFNIGRHSARVTACNTLHKLRVSEKEINKHFHWRSDFMMDTYLRDITVRSKMAPPHKMAEAIEKGEMHKIQSFTSDERNSFRLT